MQHQLILSCPFRQPDAPKFDLAKRHSHSALYRTHRTHRMHPVFLASVQREVADAADAPANYFAAALLALVMVQK